MTTVVQRSVRKRGFFGKIFKWLFVIFNIAMLFWVIAYLGSIGGMVEGAANDAEATGAAIGGTLGAGLLIFVWTAGAIILGLFTIMTRGETIIITESRK